MKARTPELYPLLEWGRANGDVATIKRLRVMVLPQTIRERIVLDRVTEETTCSPSYYDAVREALEKIVGREYRV